MRPNTWLALGLIITLAGCVTTGPNFNTSVSEAELQKRAADGTIDLALLDAVVDGYEAGRDVYETPTLESGYKPDIKSDEAGLWFQVEKVEKQLKTAGHRITDPELTAYLEGLVCKLSGPFCKDIRTYVIRAPFFNATMMPNGTMQVWSGLLLRARNEAQLTAVLGHEIGHYLRRHSLQRMRDTLAAQDFLIFMSIGTAALGVPVVGDIAGLIASGALQAYSRDHEREADKFGVLFMARHGYRIEQGAELWQQVIRERDADDENQTGGLFFASHPPPAERSKTLRKLGEKLQGSAANASAQREPYWQALKKHRFWLLRDQIRLNQPKETLELLKILAQDPENPGELKFYEGEVYRKRKKDGDLEKALSIYETALSMEGRPPETHRSMGLVLRRLDREAEAKIAFEKYLLAKPDAKDRQFILQYLGVNS